MRRNERRFFLFFGDSFFRSLFSHDLGEQKLSNLQRSVVPHFSAIGITQLCTNVYFP